MEIITFTTRNTDGWQPPRVGALLNDHYLLDFIAAVDDADRPEGMLASVNRAIVGKTESIPAILLAGTVEDACMLMNQYRAFRMHCGAISLFGYVFFFSLRRTAAGFFPEGF